MFDFLKTGLGYLTDTGPIGQLFRGGLGALAGGLLTPHAHKQTPVSVQQLNQATLPMMKESANRRLAGIMASQGAKGGMSASDIYERNNMQMELQRQIARQAALNQISANQAANNATAYNNQIMLQPWQNAIAGGLFGANLIQPKPPQNDEIQALAGQVEQLRKALGL